MRLHFFSPHSSLPPSLPHPPSLSPPLFLFLLLSIVVFVPQQQQQQQRRLCRCCGCGCGCGYVLNDSDFPTALPPSLPPSPLSSVVSLHAPTTFLLSPRASTGSGPLHRLLHPSFILLLQPLVGLGCPGADFLRHNFEKLR